MAVVAPEPGADGAAGQAAWPGPDRRQRDRRGEPTRAWHSLLGLRRRRAGRRAGEEQNTYVDVYRKRDTALLLSILVLNILDALLTLLHIQRGGAEANPLMEPLVTGGSYGAFLFQKCAVVGSLLIVLLVHKNFRIARVGMWTLLFLYVALFAYHISLQIWAVYPNG